MLTKGKTIARKGYTLYPVKSDSPFLQSEVGCFRVSVNAIKRHGETIALFLVDSKNGGDKTLEFDFTDSAQAIEVYRMMPAVRQYTSHIRSHLGHPMTPLGDAKRGGNGHLEVILTVLGKDGSEGEKFLIWKSGTFTKFSIAEEAHEVAKKHALFGIYKTEVIIIIENRRKSDGIYLDKDFTI